MGDSSAEESGWTFYLEDLLNTEQFDHENNSMQLPSACDDEMGSQSLCLVSDAASSASVMGSSKILSFKKRRSCIFSKRSSMASDDSLEDTASSPVSSPKVSDLNRKATMNRKQKECAEIIEECTSTSSTGLKRRGLCLVPVSTIVNFLG
ncbi:hypothetical protein ACET3Z_010217 [Daucus carota]